MGSNRRYLDHDCVCAGSPAFFGQSPVVSIGFFAQASPFLCRIALLCKAPRAPGGGGSLKCQTFEVGLVAERVSCQEHVSLVREIPMNAFAAIVFASLLSRLGY